MKRKRIKSGGTTFRRDPASQGTTLPKPEQPRETLPATAEPGAPTTRARPSVRLWAFRLTAAVLVPLLLLGALEIGLRLAGVGYPTSFFLPRTVGGVACHVENPRFGWRFFGPRLARTPLPLVLRDTKPPGACRIFLFGESAAYGDPQPAFGLARHLERLLEARFPDTRFEVVNTAMTAVNSHVILPIARDCARRDGDVWVVYMGNNEVVGPFGAGTVFGPVTPGLGRLRASLALQATRTGQLLAQLREWLNPASSTDREWGGMQMFLEHEVAADDARLATVYRHFARNLGDIIRTGRRSGARVVVSTVAANLRDCAPFASRHGRDAGLEEWNRPFAAGVAAQEAQRPKEAIESFQQAAAQDDQFAELQFRLGQCYLALGEIEAARSHFVRACDLDTLRFRCDSRLNEIVRQTAQGREAEGVFFADGEAALAQVSPDGLAGAEVLYEHVHLRFAGNYWLARAIAEQVARALPATVTNTAAPEWLSLEACARQLGWREWNRHEGAAQMLARIQDPPFTSQFDHRDQSQRLLEELADARRGLQPAALVAAVEAYRELLEARPEDVWLLELLARLELRRGEANASAEAWRRLLALRPQYSEARGQLARTLAMLGRDDEARAEFQALLDDDDPDSWMAREGLALLLTRQQAYDAAIAQHEELLRRRPLYSPSRLALGALRLRQGQVEEARRHYRQAVAHPLNTAPALRALGLVCFEQGWFPEAVTNLSRSLRLDPTDAVTYVRLGQALAALRRTDEAAAAYAEAVRWDPTLAEAHFRLGFERGRQGDDGGAVAHFAEAVRLDPGMLQARLNLGIAAFRQGRRDEALAQFEEVLRRDPTNAVARQYLEQKRESDGR